MYREQARVDFRIFAPSIAGFDQTHELPYRFLAAIRCRDVLACQPSSKLLAESQLPLPGNGGIVEVVIAVRIQHAVSEDGRRDVHRQSEKRLQSASRPGIAASLKNLGSADRGVEP